MMRTFSVCVILCLGGLADTGTAAAPPDDRTARAVLTTEQTLALHVDMLAKGLTQERPVYLERLLSPVVHIDGRPLPRDSAIAHLRLACLGMKAMYPSSRSSVVLAKQDAAPLAGGLQVKTNAWAIAFLEILPAESKTQVAAAGPRTLKVHFIRVNDSWNIDSLDWGSQ